jgi:general secretion pathway protein D
LPVIFVALAVLAGCAKKPGPPATGIETAPVAAPVALAGDATAVTSVAARPEGERRRSIAPAVIRGTGQFYQQDREGPPPALAPRIAVGPEVTLDFVNVDVRDVVRSVLGDLLRLTYVIDPAVQGTVTLQTRDPLPRAAVLPAIDDALRLSGVALVDKAGIINVVPAANAAREAQLNGAAAGGYVARVVTPRFVAAADLQRVLEPMLPSGSSLRADPVRNLLIVSGSAQEVANILNDVAIFDVDYLKGMSFALLPLRNAQAKDVAREVTTLVAGTGGALAGMVRITAINRLNALLVTALRPEYLDRVSVWVTRLDQGGVSSQNQQLFVYRVQNGRAAELASVLRRALGIETSGSSAGAKGSQPGGTDAADDADPSPGTSRSQGNAAAQSANPLLGGLGAGQPAARLTPDAGSEGGGTPADGTGSPTVRVTADEANNALLIMATGPEFAWIDAALHQLDIPPLQVMIETVVAEVTLTDQLTYGMQYYLKSGQFQALLAQPGTAAQSSTSSTGTAFPGFGLTSGFNLGFVGSSGSAVTLQLLQQISTVTVLSSPNLMVLNNQSARIQVGDQVPITTQSAVSVLTSSAPLVNSIEYRDTGIILQIKPRVNASGNVMLDISQEVSQVEPTTSSSLNTPTISQRRMSSSIAIRDGQTVALGGLISDSHNTSTNGIPVLQNVPVIGWLFGTKSNNTTRTELIALITPHVIYDQRGMQAATDELQRKLPLTVPAIGLKTR